MCEPIKLVIFDCDGTLVDSQHFIVDAMAEAFGVCGLDAPAAEATRGIIGLSMTEAVSALAPEADAVLVARLVQTFRGAFGSRTHETEPLYEGAEEVVRALAARPGVLLGIATGKSQRGVGRLLDRYSLGDCFVTIQTADDAPSKPHPGMIERAMDATGAGRADTVMIGDTTFDMAMAANAGVHGLGVAWGYHGVDALTRHGARHIMSHFNELESVLHALWEAEARSTGAPIRGVGV